MHRERELQLLQSDDDGVETTYEMLNNKMILKIKFIISCNFLLH